MVSEDIDEGLWWRGLHIDSQRHPGTFYAGRPLPKSGPSRS